MEYRLPGVQEFKQGGISYRDETMDWTAESVLAINNLLVLPGKNAESFDHRPSGTDTWVLHVQYRLTSSRLAITPA
jgi:hypothetical protein